MPVLLFVLFAANSLLIATSCSDYPIELCDLAGCEWVNSTRATCASEYEWVNGPSASECSGKTTRTACYATAGCEWSRAADGTCGYPDKSACLGSSACGAGCRQYEATGICQYPPLSYCARWSSQTLCETGTNGCRWHRLEADCSLQCYDLEKAACEATAGCSYSSGSGYCGQPSDHLCSGFTTESSCQTSERGCKWRASSNICRSKNCYQFESKSSCETAKGCVFFKEDHCYSVCVGITPAACNVANSSCVWVNETYDCRSPGYSECSYLNRAECSAQNSGCVWYTNKQAQCSYQDQSFCRSLSNDQCTTGSGCRLQEAYSQCTFEYSCNCFISEETCSAERGCKWETFCKIDTNDLVQCQNNSNDHPTNCDFESLAAGCRWTTYDAVCYPDSQLSCRDNDDHTACSSVSEDLGCRWLNEEGVCRSNDNLQCQANNERTACSSVSAARGCKWVFTGGGYCDPIEEDSCNTNSDSSGCVTGTNMTKCEFSSNKGECLWDWGQNCELNNCTGECSANSFNIGCVQETSSPYCEVDSNRHYCAANDDNTACSSDSSRYCVWNSGTERCRETYLDGECYDNGNKTDCDRAYSASGCSWVSDPEVCYPDIELLRCEDFENKNTCLAPCKWIDFPARCDVNTSLFCWNNPTNDGCDSVFSDPGCVWHEAVTASCGLLGGWATCTANEANTACSALSTLYGNLYGCIWKSGTCQDIVELPGPSGSASFIIIPWLSLLLMFIILL